MTASATSDRMRFVDSANTMMATPKIATTANSTLPIGSVSGRRANITDIAKAPTPGAARSSPSPQGPVCRMSRANTGNSAGAAARNTAHMSSEMVPRITRSRHTKPKPPISDCRLTGSLARGTLSIWIMKMKLAPMNQNPTARP